MELTDAIQHLKESLADPTHKWGCEECKAEHVQLLRWLEEYEKLKSDYSELLEDYEDLNKQLRKANSMADARWIPFDKEQPEEGEQIVVAITNGYTAYVEKNRAGDFESDEQWISPKNVAYWMRIPAPPEGGAENVEN